MAQEVIINVQASTAEANKNLEKLNATILEQKEILVELERELYNVESAQKETSKTNLSAQKALRDEANI
jgi:cell division protein FtsL